MKKHENFMLSLIFFSFFQDFSKNSKIGHLYLSIFETLEYFWTFYLQNYIINGQSNLKNDQRNLSSNLFIKSSS